MEPPTHRADSKMLPSTIQINRITYRSVNSCSQERMVLHQKPNQSFDIAQQNHSHHKPTSSFLDISMVINHDNHGFWTGFSWFLPWFFHCFSHPKTRNLRKEGFEALDGHRDLLSCGAQEIRVGNVVLPSEPWEIHGGPDPIFDSHP